jgi:MerR family transcriptional regulator, light-induced transcriptional regulator
VPHFSPKQAAKALGVSESSVKRWCDSGTVPALRTAGGHRRIPRQCLEKLLAQGGIVDLGKALPGVTAQAESRQQDAGSVPAFETLVEHQTAFRLALQIGQDCRCRQLIRSLLACGYSRFAAADALITDAMHQFGHLWEQGDLAIYQERRACGICLGLIHDLKQSLAIASDGPIAIGGAPRGDVYQLPSQLVELALCEQGWRATSIGCNLPIDSFAAAVQEYRPKLLWMSLSVVEAQTAFVGEFNQLADALRQKTALIIGGRAANDSLRPRLRYTAHCDSLEQLCELTTALTH